MLHHLLKQVVHCRKPGYFFAAYLLHQAWRVLLRQDPVRFIQIFYVVADVLAVPQAKLCIRYFSALKTLHYISKQPVSDAALCIVDGLLLCVRGQRVDKMRAVFRIRI